MSQHHESPLVKYFDGVLENFHDWLDHLKQHREERNAELEAQIDQELDVLVQKEDELLDPQPTYTPVIPRRDAWRFWIVGGIVALLAYFLFQSLEFLYLIATGFILSMAAENFIQYIQKYLPRGFSMVIVYLLLIVFIFSGVMIIIPFIIQQTAELLGMLIDSAVVMQQDIQNQGITARINSSRLPNSIKTSLTEFLVTTNIQASIQSTLVDNIDQVVAMGSSYVRNAGDLAVTILSNTFAALYQILIVFTVAVFCTVEKNGVIRFFSSFAADRMVALQSIARLYHKLGNWLVGQLILCFAVGVTVWIGLGVIALLGFPLPNTGTLALIAGLTEFVPYLGPLLGALPAMFVATIVYGRKGLVVVGILYTFVQWLENNILVPLVMSQTLGVSPLVVFITILICGLLLGVLGVIIAVPISVILTMVYQARVGDIHKNKIQ